MPYEYETNKKTFTKFNSYITLTGSQEKFAYRAIKNVTTIDPTQFTALKTLVQLNTTWSYGIHLIARP